MTAEFRLVCDTGKHRFTSERAARHRLDSIRRSPRRTGKVPIRVHDCPLCGGWHLTSSKHKGSW